MIEGKNIVHFYGKEQAIDGISLRIPQGEFAVLAGKSGGGKSTLLAILSTLLRPSSGSVRLAGEELTAIRDLDRFRRKHLGFVFQFHYLIPYLSIAENIELAADREHRGSIGELLERLGIGELADRRADEISGGQRQRAAIARAVVNRPAILFADEPTGNLDSANSRKVFELFRELSEEGTTLLVATHDRDLAQKAHRRYTIEDGRLV